MIRVLVVDDSPVAKELLVHILRSDPAVQVVATANNGEEALEAVERIKPDIITMDVHMPKMNGLDASRRIMETHPTPIVVVSGSFEPEALNTTFRALEAGAVAVVKRPAGIGHAEHVETSAELLRTVKAMSEVKVVRRWARHPRAAAVVSPSHAAEPELRPSPVPVNIIGIGASTGGPLALQTILSELPADFRVPILVVQHIAPGFVRGFAEWLDRCTKLRVRVAMQNEAIVPGGIYVAPDGWHMRVSAVGTISLSGEPPENGLRPSVSSLFRSLAATYGQQALGVLLTGMGKDGAEELRLIKEKGGITIAQDEESSVVYGMPGEAIRLGGATYVFPTARIAGALLTLARHKERDQ
jgi:two-component system, chemotaxis family, protein-glutamate methylesterase/glutaminase